MTSHSGGAETAMVADSSPQCVQKVTSHIGGVATAMVAETVYIDGQKREKLIPK